MVKDDLRSHASRLQYLDSELAIDASQMLVEIGAGTKTTNENDPLVLSAFICCLASSKPYR